MTFYEKVITICTQNGVAITSMCEQIGLTKSAATNWKTTGATPRPSTVKKVADFFGVPVEYFSTDVDINVSTVQDNHGIIGNTHAPVTINGSGDVSLGDIEKELVALCGKMDMKQKNTLLSKAYEILEGKV